MARGGRLLLAASLIVTSSTLLVRLADPDLFGHMAVGRWILAHRAIPTRDPFAFSSAGPFRYTEALADVLLQLANAGFGMRGIGLLQVVFGAALLALVVMRARGSGPARALVAALVLAASFAAMALKPQVFSYLLFAGLLAFLDRATSRDPKRLLLVPLLFLAWANLHRAGVFGLAVLAAAAAGFALDRATRKHAAWLGAAAVISLAALLVNSGGVYYVTSAFDVLGRASFHERIDEWQPLTLRGVRAHHLAIVPLLALAVGERAVRRRRIDAEFVVLCSTIALATRGARLVPFVAIASAAPAVRAVDAIRAWLSTRARAAYADTLLALMAVAVPMANYERAVPPGFRGLGVCEALVPVDAARFLEEHRPPGHLFHSFDFGGYFLYALAPETPVLIDGRNDTVYDDALFRAVTDAETSRAAFDDLDRRFGFAVAVFRWTGFGQRRGAMLAGDPSWALVYWDDVAAVYAHRGRAAQVVEALAYRTLRVDDALARALDRPDDTLLDELRRNAREAPRSARAHYVLSVALESRRAHEEAAREEAIAVQLADDKGFEIAVR